MSLFNTKFENAAKALADSDDEVLQAAGLMAQMRLETLKLRLRGAHGTKALTPWDPNPPRFSFGIPNYPYGCNIPANCFGPPYGQNSSVFGSSSAQNNPPRFGSASSGVFGAAPSSNTFGAAPSSNTFGSAPTSVPSTGLTFGAAPTPFGAAPTVFGGPTVMSSNQESTPIASVSTTATPTFGSQAVSSVATTNETGTHTFGAVFGIPISSQNQLEQNN